MICRSRRQGSLCRKASSCVATRHRRAGVGRTGRRWARRRRRPGTLGTARKDAGVARRDAGADARHGRHSAQGCARGALRYGRGPRPRHGQACPRHNHVRAPGCACVRLGVLLGQQAVHLVHSAYFNPFLTQYCS